MRRLLLIDDAPREAVARVFEGLGWRAVDAPVQSSQTVAFKRSWVDPGGREAASHIENRPFDCAFVFASDGAVEALARALDEAGLLLPPAQAAEPDLGSEDQARRSIGRLGLMAHGPVDNTVLSRLVALLVQPDPRWQRLALYSLSYAGWPELDAALAAAIDADAFEDGLADAARALLADLRASDWNRALYAEPDADPGNP